MPRPARVSRGLEPCERRHDPNGETNAAFDARRAASFAIVVVAVVVVVAVAPIVARADLGEVPLLGDQANLMGGAVAATIRGGDAMWYNPAGLALPTFDRASVNISGIGYAIRWLSAPGLVQGAGSPPTSVGAQNITVLPRVTTVILAPKHTLRFGFGIFSPVRQDVNLQLAAMYPFDGGQAGNSLSQKTIRTSTHVVFSFAVRKTPKLQIGASLHVVAYRYFDMYSLGSVFDSSTANADQAFTVDTQIANFGAGIAGTFGVEYTPLGWLKVGASVTTPSMILFERRQDQYVQSTTAMGEVDASETRDHSRNFTFAVPEPAIVRFGAAITLPKATLEVDGDLVTPAKSGTFDVERGFSANARVGALVQLIPKLRLGLGFFTSRGGTSRVSDTLGATAVNGLGATAGVMIFSRPPNEVQRAAHKATYAMTFALRYIHYKGSIIGAAIAQPGDESSLAFLPTPVTANDLALHIGIAIVF